PIGITREASTQLATPVVSPPLLSHKPIERTIEPAPVETSPGVSPPIEPSAPHGPDAAVSLAAASPTVSASKPRVQYSKPVAERSPSSLGLRVSQTPFVTPPMSESKPA